MGILNLEHRAIFVAAALTTSESVYTVMFSSVSSALKFIVECNRWDPFNFFRSGSQMCGKEHWRVVLFF